MQLGGEQEQSLLESGAPSCRPARGPGMQSRTQRAMPTPCARGIGRNRGMDAAEQHAAPTNSPPAGGTSPQASATAPLPSVPAPGGGPHTPSPPWHGSNHAQEPPAPRHSLRGGRGPCKEVPGGLRLPLAPWRGLGGVPGGGQPNPFQRRWAQRRAERGLADSWLVSDAPSCDARSRASSSRPGSSTTKLRLTGWGTHAVPGTARHLKCTGGHPASTAPACCPPPGGLLLTRGQQKGAEKPREALGCPGSTRRWLRPHKFYPILAATMAKHPAEPWDRPQHPGLGGERSNLGPQL